MKGEERYLTQLMEGTRTRFHIPVYQRNYDWHIEHCKRLFDDLESLVADSKESHFFGGIVSTVDRDIRVIIDGQQRLTTIALLLVALAHKLEDGMVSEDKNLPRRIREDYLTDRYHDDEPKLKLRLVKDDDAALGRVFRRHHDLVKESTVTQNYLYFCKRIDDMTCSSDELFDAVEKLLVIDITLKEEDNPQLVFESLNSTGLELSEGDKIRNFILMGLPTKTQEEYYDEYWHPIEENTSFDVSAFIRFYLAATKRETPTVQRVYRVFKEYVGTSDMEIILKNLVRYSVFYKRLQNAKTGMRRVDRVLARVNLLEVSVLTPFLLLLLDYLDSGHLNEIEAVGVLTTVETYLFRRWVCGVPTNSLNKVFETLHGDVLRAKSASDGYLDVLNFVLCHKEGSSRLPDDEEFSRELEVRDFYHIQSKRFYLYDRLENGDSRERMDIVGDLQAETLTVEHIMPQTLTLQWREALGEDSQQIYLTWVNRLANLTLTGYNGKYSNRDFEAKRTMEHGFADSGLRLNKWIAKQPQWTLNEILERNRRLQEQALALWPLPTSTFTPCEQMHGTHSLDEEFDFTGRRIAAYTFMGIRHTVKMWKAMTIEVMEAIYELQPQLLHRLVVEDKFPASYFSDSPALGREELAPGRSSVALMGGLVVD